MSTQYFDDSHITWHTLDGFAHLWYNILAIDEANQIVDVLFKFAGQQQIVLHRHKTLNQCFVVQGEHRLYEPDGRLKEIRKVGSYTISQAKEEPHREGGGEIDTIVLFSIRGTDGLFYEILDDDFNVLASLGMAEFVGLFNSQ